MNYLETKAQDLAWQCLPSENFQKSYELGRRDALAGQWRSVVDELPETDDDVLVIYSRSYTPKYKEKAIAYYDGEDWYTQDGEHIRPSHWMSIPEPTKYESE